MIAAGDSSFGALLRRYRRAAGLSQGELARRARLSLRGISDLERGINRAPRRETVRLLAAGLALAEKDNAALEAAAGRARDPSPPPAPQAPEAAVLPPLIGRARELLLLRHYAGEEIEPAATAGAAPLLLLAGEPGIGKTRLLYEATTDAAGCGWTVLQGGCQRRGGHEPYAPVLEALRTYVARRSPAALRAELRGCDWLVRLLPELAGRPAEQLPALTLSPEQERRLTFGAVARFLANVAGPAGTLLVLDDLQWAGPDALDLLTTLARSASGAASSPLRMIGAYRHTEVEPDGALATTLADLAHGRLAAQHTLGPLAPAEATDLLDALLRGMDGTQGLRERLLGRAGGVPFFLVSLAQAARAALLERDGTEQGDGAGDIVRWYGIPWDIAQSVRQRVAALPEAARALLSVAAVLGRDVPRALLDAASGRPETEVVAGLAAACQARLLVEVGEGAYRFPHDVIREVVEADLGAAGRAALHRQIARALEREGAPEDASSGAGEESVEAIAYHYARTGEHLRAAHWLERAGDRAAAGFANATAVADYLAAREHLVAGAGDRAALSRLDEKLGDVYLRMGEYGGAQESFARARAQASDASRRAELGRKEGVCWEKRGEYARALAAFDQTEDEAGHDREGGLPPGVRAALELSRGEVLYAQGEYEQAEAAAERARVLLAGAGSGEAERALAGTDYLQGRVAWARGDLARAEEHHRRGLARRERLGDLEGIAACWHNLGHIAFDRAELGEADARFRRSLALRERIGDAEGVAACWNNLGNVAYKRGDLTGAEECYRRSLLLHERVGDQEGIGLCWHNLGIIAFDQGELAEAEECFRRSLAIKERLGNQWGIALSWTALGAASLRRGDLAAAEEQHQRSRAIGEAIGDQWGLAYTWLNLGEVALERGDAAAAAARYRAARHLARRIHTPDTEAHAALGHARTLLYAAAPGTLTCTRLRAVTALLEHGQALAARQGLAGAAVDAALLAAEIQLRQENLPAARVAADEALRRAVEGGFRREGAIAHRLLGLAADDPGAARAHLEIALTVLAEIGAVLELARTRLAMARAPAGAPAAGGTPEEAHRLLAQARGAFIVSGARRDLAAAETLSAAWAER